MFGHLGAEIARHRGAAALIDVEPVGADTDGDHGGAKFPQHGGGDPVGRAVCAVDDDFQVVEPQAAREGGLGGLDIAAGGVVQPGGAAKCARGGEAGGHVGGHQRLDLAFRRVGQFAAVGVEQLDAVVLERIVGGRQHHPKVCAQAARQHGDRRGRQRADEGHVHPGADEAGGERGFQHVAREPGVLADHHPVAMWPAGEQEPGGLAEAERGLRGHRIDIGGTADTVGAEQAAGGIMRSSSGRQEVGGSAAAHDGLAARRRSGKRRDVWWPLYLWRLPVPAGASLTA